MTWCNIIYCEPVCSFDFIHELLVSALLTNEIHRNTFKVCGTSYLGSYSLLQTHPPGTPEDQMSINIAVLLKALWMCYIRISWAAFANWLILTYINVLQVSFQPKFSQEDQQVAHPTRSAIVASRSMLNQWPFWLQSDWGVGDAEGQVAEEPFATDIHCWWRFESDIVWYSIMLDPLYMFIYLISNVDI